jgi:hypothetical protein
MADEGRNRFIVWPQGSVAQFVKIIVLPSDPAKRVSRPFG